MRFLDRRALKRSARDLIREPGAGALAVSLVYLLLTDGLSTVLNLVLTNPIGLILNQWSESLSSLLQQNGSPEEFNLTPVYSATFSYARQMLFNPKQEIILFVFLLLFLYMLVLSYGYSDWALRRVRGEQPGWTCLFDRLELAGKFILLELLSLLLVGLGLSLFILPGLYFLYSLRMARFLLLDDPTLSVFQAMRRSRQMSRGYKRQLFTLDLSFLGWMILSNLALSGAYSTGASIHPLLGAVLGELSFLVFQVYIAPYRELSLALYYESMRAPQGNEALI